MTVEYSFYAEEYGGTLLGADAWPAACTAASRRLCADTQGRMNAALQAEEQAPDTALAVRLAVCAVAEALYEASLQKRTGGAVTAEKVGTWSRSYDADALQTAARRAVANAEALYLAHTGLLYRGCGCA